MRTEVLCISVLRVASGPRVKLDSCKSAVNPTPVVYSTDSTFVRFALVWFCLFPLPLGVWEGLRFVIVALPGLFSYLFFWF